MEGIRSANVNGRQPIVTRIGGRSKTEELKSCVLYEKVSLAKKRKTIPRSVYRPYSDARKVMVPLKNRIIQCLSSIQHSRNRLLRAEQLEPVMHDHHYSQLTALTLTKLPLEVWLGIRFLVTVQTEEEETEKVQTDFHNTTEETFETYQDELIHYDDNEVQRIQDDRLVDKDNKVLFQIPMHYRFEGDFSNSDCEETGESNDGWKVVQMSKNKRERLIEHNLSYGLKAMEKEEVDSVMNIWSLSKQEKWTLYLHWRNNYIELQKKLLEEYSDRYKDSCSDLQKRKQDLNLSVVAGTDVVGMTTTGAAKHNYIIKGIRPKIVIVEEAAEIFEAHIFASLAPSVQQLVLIGDHEQLRPKPTYYELEKNYKLDVSLFERLTKNKCPVKTLSIQHRMRPEIASLITPTIYPVLYNHVSVEEYDHIQGVDKSLFFIAHTELELSSNSDNKSHSNRHEAMFLAALCEYFIKQDYDVSQITILTLY